MASTFNVSLDGLMFEAVLFMIFISAAVFAWMWYKRYGGYRG